MTGVHIEQDSALSPYYVSTQICLLQQNSFHTQFCKLQSKEHGKYLSLSHQMQTLFNSIEMVPMAKPQEMREFVMADLNPTCMTVTMKAPVVLMPRCCAA